MNSTVVKRSIVINGRKTSVSIEDMFWRSLKEVAKDSRMTVSDLVCVIAANRAPGSNLSSAIRVYILTCFTGLLHALRSGGEFLRRDGFACAQRRGHAHGGEQRTMSFAFRRMRRHRA